MNGNSSAVHPLFISLCHIDGVHTDREDVVLLNHRAEPVGRQPKATVHHAATPLHLAFSVFLFDGAGHTLVQQRAWHKPTWPGVWSNACCGHPGPGEPLADAARRRLRFELGITAPPDLELALPRFRYRARWRDLWENEVCPVFVATYDGPVFPQPNEVAAVRWIRWDDFVRASGGAGASEYDAFSPWSRWEAAALQRAGKGPARGEPLAVGAVAQATVRIAHRLRLFGRP